MSDDRRPDLDPLDPMPEPDATDGFDFLTTSFDAPTAEEAAAVEADVVAEVAEPPVEAPALPLGMLVSLPSAEVVAAPEPEPEPEPEPLTLVPAPVEVVAEEPVVAFGHVPVSDTASDTASDAVSVTASDAASDTAS